MGWNTGHQPIRHQWRRPCNIDPVEAARTTIRKFTAVLASERARCTPNPAVISDAERRVTLAREILDRENKDERYD